MMHEQVHVPAGRFRALQRPMRLAWMVTAGVAAADVIGGAALGFSVPLGTSTVLGGVGGGMLALAWVYTYLRPNARIAAGASTAAFLVVFTMLLAISSYVGIALALPLWDGRFASLDGALGFDWTAHLRFVVDHPALETALEVAYHSSLVQVALVVVLLVASGRLHRLGQFTLLFAATATSVIAISTLMPALGAYAWHEPPSALLAALSDGDAGRWHLAHFRGLRDGTLRTVPLADVQGLISFPSFHTALALVCVWAVAPIRWTVAPMLLLNALLVAATLSIGGHYLVDVVGGALVAAVAISIVARGVEVTRADSSSAEGADDAATVEDVPRLAA